MTRRNQGDRIVADRPDQPAIIGVDAPTLTYRELESAVQSAAALVAERVSPGRTVGILAENSPAWVIAFFAIQRAGAVPVPISHRLPPDGVAFVVGDADLEFAFVSPTGRRLLGDHPLPTVPLERLYHLPPRPFRTVEPEPGALGMILYTSGTTGPPKGVELTQESHLWVIDQTSEPTEPGTVRTIISAPLYHMNALTNTQRLLASGGTIVLLPRFAPVPFLAAIEQHRVTDLSGVPPMFAMLASHTDEIARRDLSSVQRVSMASAPASATLFRQIGEWFPGAPITFGYGTTESGPVVFAPHPDGLPTPVESVGTAHPAVTLRLVDEHGRPTSGEGVLEIRSPALMKGYRKRPDLVPPVTPDGFHHTKDIFRVDEHGFYFFQGREDDMFSSGGENVFPRAVERVLESHPAVAEAVVLPLPDEVKGAKPVAFVTLKPGAAADEDTLKQHVLRQLEPFAHPRRVWVIEEIPLSATNKADRKLLADRAARLAGGAV